MAASLNQGRFKSPADYCADDLEAYAGGSISLLNVSINRGSLLFQSGVFPITKGRGNFSTDDLEQESLGTIHTLSHGERNGDTLFKTGKFH